MLAETGHFALVLALMTAFVTMLLPVIGSVRRDHALLRVAIPGAIAQFLLVLIAFLALMQAHIVSDFSVANVYDNSHSLKPLIYKIAGVWGNHEGSMVLWVLILTIFGASVAIFGTNLPIELRGLVLAVQGSIAFAFLTFMVLTSNPFARLNPAPIEGLGLNPVLQDPALAFHPPFLYMGYVGFSMAFSFAVAALIDGRIDAAWARWVRPWTLAAWMCLSVGIAMGSWWAYYELGWGGFWFWDPVENASFMPWLCGTALLHSAVVMEKRDALKVWTILLAILTFSLSLLGTFLVRSGVLTSVHAFAVDPARGIAILIILAIFIGGALVLFAWRAPALKSGGIFQPISREGGLILNNLLLTVSCGAVLFGTLYPLLREATDGAKISVGAPYFNIAFGILMVPLLVAVPFGPMLGWKRGDLAAASQRLYWVMAAAFLAFILTRSFIERGPWMAPIGIALGIWLICGALADVGSRIRLGSIGLAQSAARFFGLPRSAHGTWLAHFGLGFLVIGIVSTSAWRQEHILAMKPGESAEIAGYNLTFKGTTNRKGPNFSEVAGVFEVRRGGALIAVLEPAKRTFPAEHQATTEAGILPTWTGDLYTVVGDDIAGGGKAVRLYFHPMVRLIWISAIVMFLAGALSLSDRRLRVGAPRRKRPEATIAGAPA